MANGLAEVGQVPAQAVSDVAAGAGADRRVRMEQIALLHKTPVALLGNMLNGAVVASVLWGVAPLAPLVAWYGLIVGSSLIRLFLRHRYLRRKPSLEGSLSWGRVYAYGAGLNGCLWGLLAAAIHILDPVLYQSFVAVCILGMGAGAVATHSVYLPAAFAFLLPSAGALGLALLTKGGDVYLVMGILSIIFIALMSWVAFGFNRTFVEKFALQIANENLIGELSAARESLETRVGERTAELQQANLDLKDQIDERNRAEQALRESRDQLRLITDNLPVLIAAADRRGRFRFVNKVTELWYDRPAEQLLGRPVDAFLSEASYGKIKPHIESVLSGQNVTSSETLEYPDGVTRDVEVMCLPDFGANKKVRGWFALIVDVTERKRAEEQLRHAQKLEAVGQLTGGVAHDFNNLLAVIMGNADVLLTRLGEQDRPTQAVIRAATRGAELTQRLLAFSRQQPLRPQIIDLDALVEGMSDMLHRTLGETIEISIASTDGLWRAEADPGQLENALLNLALNARDAMSGGGTLTIETKNVVLDQDITGQADVSPGEYVMLAVSDTGRGMSAEVAEHAFEPFFTTKEIGEGSGLGLSMVYGFVKQSGGHVTIYSERSHGATVKLYLPRAQDAGGQVGRENEPGEDPRAKGETILVLEDDAEVRLLTVRLLRDLDYEVLEAEDGASALAVLAGSRRIDALLADVMLPGGMNGPKVAEEALRRTPNLKVLFMSGYAEKAIRHHGPLSHGAELLQKPFRRRDLAQKLRAVLDSP